MNTQFRYGLDHLTIEIALKLMRDQIKGLLIDDVKSKIKQSYDN